MLWVSFIFDHFLLRESFVVVWGVISFDVSVILFLPITNLFQTNIAKRAQTVWNTFSKGTSTSTIHKLLQHSNRISSKRSKLTIENQKNGQTRRLTSCMSKIYLNLFIRGFFWLPMNQSIWTLIDLFWAVCWVYNFSPSVKCFYQLKFTPLLITMHQLESLIPNLLSLSDLYQELRCGGSFPDWIKYLEATKHLAMNQHK